MTAPSPWLDELGRPLMPQDGLLPVPDLDTLFPFLQPLRDGRPATYQRRVTQRQRADVTAGRHPLTGEPINDRRTCGGCVFRGPGGARSGYWKCHRGEKSLLSHSTRTDVRAWWPACPRWQRG